MTEPMTEPREAPEVRDRRSRTRIILVAGLALALALVVGVGGASLLRWRADRSYVGTDAGAELSWGPCLNGIGWTDPSNGVGWWAGHDIVVNGQYESEPARVHTLQPDDRRAPPIRSVQHSSEGRIHFDSYDRATFTSRTGGTMVLTRPPRNAAYTGDCVGVHGNSATQPRPSTVVWAEIAGVLGHRVPGNPDLVLAKGVIHVDVDGIETEAVPVDGQAPFIINVPVGTVTLRGVDDRGACGALTVRVAGGDHATGDLLCDRP